MIPINEHIINGTSSYKGISPKSVLLHDAPVFFGPETLAEQLYFQVGI